MVETFNEARSAPGGSVQAESFDHDRIQRDEQGIIAGSLEFHQVTATAIRAVETDRFVSYASVARTLHRLRLAGAVVIAVGLGIVAIVQGVPQVWVSSFIASLVAVHALWRVRRPGASPDDAIHLDNLAVFAYIALLRPPIGVVIIGALYMLSFAGLFLTPKAAAMTAAYVVGGLASVTWAFPAEPMQAAMALELAVVFLVASVPPTGWLVGRLADGLSGRRRMTTELMEAASYLQRLFVKSVVPMFRSTLDGRLLDANEALIELFAASDLAALQTEPLSRRYFEPELRTGLTDRLRADGAVVGFDVQLRRVDGTEFWGRISASLVETNGGPVIEGVIEDVTAERQADRDARITASVFEQLGSAVIVSDAERRVTTWNRQAEIMFGLGTGEAFGRLTSDVLTGTEPGMAERVRQQLAVKGHWEGEADVVGAGGVPVPVAVSATTVTDEDGDVVAYAMVFTDLSDIHQARRQVRFQASLLAQVYHAVIATDLDGNVTYWNPAAEHLYGWTEREAIGRPIRDMTVPDRGATRAAEIMESIAYAGAWQGEFEVRRKDGTTFPALVANRLVHNEHGEPTGVVGVSTDISDLKAAQREAQRSGELARSVLDAIYFPVAVVGESGEILDVNGAWISFALENGGDPDRTGVGINYLDLCAAAAEFDPTLKGVVSGINDVLAGRVDSFTHDYACHSPDTKRWFTMEATPINGVGAVIAHIDMTAEVTARQALELAVEEKDQFLATISHELRTPLTAVVGFAEHLRSGHAEPDELPDHLEVLADQAREVADLVEDLLLAGRLDTDTIVVRPEIQSTRALIESVIRPFTDRATIDIAIDADAQSILADPLRTRQIMRNLVTNAARHGAPPITIHARSRNHRVLIDVIDRGPGVPTDSVGQLYQPYADLTASHGQPGSVGLGLYVSQRLAKLMKGEITYRRLDDTTVFTLELPGEEPVIDRQQPLG